MVRIPTGLLLCVIAACAAGDQRGPERPNAGTADRRPSGPPSGSHGPAGHLELKAAAAAAGAGNLPLAYQHCLDAIRKNPQLEHAYRLAASICAMQGNAECERQNYDDGLTALPRSPALLRDRALLHLEQGQYAAAVNRYERALAITGETSPEAMADLAYAYVYVDRLDEADRLARRAVEIDDACFSCQMALGQVCLSSNDFPDAVTAFSQARNLSPRDPDARRSEAKARFLAGEVRTAHQLYEALVVEYPDDARLRVQAAQVAMGAKAYDAAVTHLEVVAAANPDQEQLLRLLAKARTKAKNARRATSRSRTSE